MMALVRGLTVADRIEGGVLGLLIGDALGVPYEFKPQEDIPATISFEPPADFPRSHEGVPRGTWSDDGAMALCLLASLLYRGGLDVEDLGNRFVNWMRVGYMAVDYEVFDIGAQTAHALAAVEAGTPAHRAGGSEERSNGNGSLMRVLPLALWHTGSDADLIADAHLQSKVTHAHPRSMVCCALYCLWARGLLEEIEEPWESAVATLEAHYQATSRALARELREEVLPDHGNRGSGYVVHTLHTAREALRAPTFEQVAFSAIRFGDDTDTNAAVAGGLAGIAHGRSGIPREWVAALRGKDILEPLVAQL